MISNTYSSWPCFSDSEAQIVADVLKSNRVNYWTGTFGKEFESKFAAWVQTGYAIAISNGTVALELALRALEIGPGDEVIVPPRTFFATVSAVVMVGATPVFVDIDSVSHNICPKSVAAHITEKTKAVICVHLAGWPCDMDAIKSVCQPANVKIVEDCAQAHGARYKGQPVGGLGDIAAWSFCQDKIITTAGEGGMVTTNDEKLYKAMWEYKDHGKSYDVVHATAPRPGFRWLHESFGSNYRLTEMQAAVGIYQLARVDAWVERRRLIAAAYGRVIDDYAFVDYGRPPSSSYHAHYRFYARWEHPSVTRDEFVARCVEAGLPAFQGSCPEVYREKACEDRSFGPPERLPVARRVGEQSVMLLTHPSLTDDEVADLCSKLEMVLVAIESKS
ncbi:DegT/DnrJ/EryC1/StrS family aminotransferase [Kordiimonas sp.]|uniref:DegT/DnrJ/EryC1/StrS family aminotransferase n=1 Tax=Kordiimonas sp. TaxID=1970157 RepID=UPI003A913282